MLTRSNTRNGLFKVDIDFDQASNAWKANKKTNGNGTYVYICLQLTKGGNQCQKKPLSGCEFCKIHKKYIKN
jgi:hypothetical protein